MHDVMKHLNMIIALPAERLQHGVNIYILPFHGLMRQSTVNVAMCLMTTCHVSCMYIIYKVLSLQCTASNK